MRVLVLGGSGLIGSSVCESLVKLGHTVIATSTRHVEQQGSVRYLQWRIPGLLEPRWLEAVDAVLYAVYDPKMGEAASVESLSAVMRQAHGVGVGKQILLSSISADVHSGSAYGREKGRLEVAARKVGAVVVRPGLVIGPGGVFQRIENLLLRWPCFPLLGSGRQKVHFVGLDALVEALCRLACETATEKDWSFFEGESILFREMLQDIARARGLRRLLLPLPAGLIQAGVWLLEKLGLPLPVTSSNLSGLEQNSNPKCRSNLHHFQSGTRSFLETYLANQRKERATNFAKS